MASLLEQYGRMDSPSNPEPPPWAREVANSMATRPSRASSLISTRTRFSTTTFQEDARSIDLSIGAHHFRISRDGSKVTSVNPGESLPAYPFSPVHEPSQHDRPTHRYVAFHLDSDTNLPNEPVEEFGEGQAALSAQSHLTTPTAHDNSGTPSSTGSDGSIFNLRPEVSDASDRPSGIGVPLDKANTLSSMAVRIQRAWRSYVQYRGPSSGSVEPISSLIRGANQPPTDTQNGSALLPALTIPRQASVNPQVHQSDAAPIPVPILKKSKAVLDKELPILWQPPIPGKPTTIPVGGSGLSLFTTSTRRAGARNIDRGSHISQESFLSVADGPETTDQLPLRKWFTGEGTRPFRDTDGPAPTPIIQPAETIDSENDVSNHYTRMIRFIDRDHRRALHARDKEMAELRERLNEKDIVYRQELRARDFLIEDLKKRLDHSEEQMEAEIEQARNAVEDLWESRWKDRDFHLRERMQRMESDMQKTMEMGIAEREAAWSAKYEKLRRTLEVSETAMDE